MNTPEAIGKKWFQNPELALRRFALLANQSSLHPYDWNRFYGFISIAHRLRCKWGHYKVKALLCEYGLKPEKAERLAEAYWHARCVLYIRGKDCRTPGYGKWSAGPPLT